MEMGQLKRPRPGSMCQKRSGRPRSTVTKSEAHDDGGDGEQLADDDDVVHLLVVIEVGRDDHHHAAGGQADEKVKLAM
jgi:hypothetical protein